MGLIISDFIIIGTDTSDCTDIALKKQINAPWIIAYC